MIFGNSHDAERESEHHRVTRSSPSASDVSTTIGGWEFGRRRAPSRARAHVAGFGLGRIGLIAVLVTFVVASLNFALQMQAFSGPDESAHLGYAHSITSGRLPEIDDPIEAPIEATDWRQNIAEAGDAEHRSVWVANHPPLFYVAVAPLIWLSDSLDRGDGGLLFVRLANVFFATLGLVMTNALAMIVTGGSRRVALAATAVAAFLPLVHYTFGAGINDGLAFLSATGVLLAAARLVTVGFRQRDLILVGAWAVVAAGTRASAMFLAVLVVLFVAAHQALRSDVGRAALARRSAMIIGVGLGPAVLLFGWFYARNVALYGDLTGSSFLLDYFDFPEGSNLLEVVTTGSLWSDVYHRLTSTSAPGERYQTAPFLVAAGFGAAALIGVILTARRGRRAAATVRRPPFALCGFATAAVVGMLAVHASDGGSPHARYLLPALGAGCTLFAIGLDRLWPGVLPAAAAATACLWSAHFIPSQLWDIGGYFAANPPLRGIARSALGLIGTVAASVALGTLVYLAADAMRRASTTATTDAS